MGGRVGFWGGGLVRGRNSDGGYRAIGWLVHDDSGTCPGAWD